MIAVVLVAVTSGAILANLVVVGWMIRTRRQVARRPLVRLEWVNHIPVAVVESDVSTVDEISRWFEAAKEGPVLRA